MGVAAAVSFRGWISKPRSSISTRTPPAIGSVVHWLPHSTVLAACQVGPGAMPRPSAIAATELVSVARPARTTSAPAASASVIGSCPIRPTMCSQRSIVSAESGPAGSSARMRPESRASRTTRRSSSLQIVARVNSSFSSRAISSAMAAIHSTPASVPAVAHVVTTSGMSARREAISRTRRSRLTAARDVFAVPLPEIVRTGVRRPAVHGDRVGAHGDATGDVSSGNPPPSIPTGKMMRMREVVPV